jgi:hypothetical protein
MFVVTKMMIKIWVEVIEGVFGVSSDEFRVPGKQQEHPRNTRLVLNGEFPGLMGHILYPLATVFVASYKICS